VDQGSKGVENSGVEGTFRCGGDWQLAKDQLAYGFFIVKD
jgi:hypothetical protein